MSMWLILYNNRIQKFSSEGGFLAKWGSKGSDDGQFNYPFGVAVDGSGMNVYVADDNDRIQKFSSEGVFLAKWGSKGSDDGQFNYPCGVAVEGSGNIYVADSGNRRIQKFAYPTLIELDQFGAASQGNQIIIIWNTASELNNAGFNLWRGEAKDGKYTRINSKIIEAEGGATLKTEYSYSDNTAKAGVTYYYKLEDIDLKGASTFHGSVSIMIPMTKSAADYYPPYWVGMYSKPVWSSLYYMNYSL